MMSRIASTVASFKASTLSLHLNLSNACCVALPGAPSGMDCSANETTNATGCSWMVLKAASRFVMSSPTPVITIVGRIPSKVPALLV